MADVRIALLVRQLLSENLALVAAAALACAVPARRTLRVQPVTALRDM